MKITIDTKEDSHEEIKKAINLLTSLLGQVPSNTDTNNIFSENSDSSGGSALTTLFGNDSSSETQTLPPEDPEEKKDEDAEVQFIY